MTTIAVKQSVADGDVITLQWRPFDHLGRWLGPSATGTLDELLVRWPQARVCLLLDSTTLITRRIHFQAKERRHLAKLIPFELEPDIAGDLNSLHIVSGMISGNTVIAAYTDRTSLGQQINRLESAGLEVSHCFAESQLLESDEQVWALNAGHGDSADVSWIDIAWDGVLAAGCEVGMATPVLTALTAQQSEKLPEKIRLFGKNESVLATMQGLLPEALTANAAIETKTVADSWDALNPASTRAINLRQGELAVPLRWRKYWRPLRLPVQVAAAALALYIVTGVVEIQLNNAGFRQLQTEVESVYRRAVPQGVLVDAEQQLTTQLSQLRGSGQQGQLMSLMNDMAPHLSAASSVRLHRLSYSARQGGAGQTELQLAVTAESNAEILALSEALNDAGLQTRAQNISRAGDRQQASLLVSRSN